MGSWERLRALSDVALVLKMCWLALGLLGLYSVGAEEWMIVGIGW